MRFSSPLRFVCKAVITFSLVVTWQATIGQETLSPTQALDLVRKNSKTLGLDATTLNELAVSKSYHDGMMDADLVYLQETYLGVPVYNSIKTLAFKKDQLVSVAGERFEVAKKFGSVRNRLPVIKPLEAIAAAARDIRTPVPASRNALRVQPGSNHLEFDGLGISQEHITAGLFWVRQSGELRLAWQVFIVPFKSSDMWLIHVDANSGKIIEKFNLTVSCHWDMPGHATLLDEPADHAGHFMPPPPPPVSGSSYRVLPFPLESPSFGGFSVVTDPWTIAGAGNNATTLGWHNDGTSEYNITRGNNVWAKEDADGNNESTIGKADTSSTGSAPYSFEQVFDEFTSPSIRSNQRAATTNLFYSNNYIHDLMYQYGFDEVSGNFQNDNMGRGGSGLDYVLADAQDGLSSNNANFGTPPDGSKPRMQMFLWSPSQLKLLEVHSSETFKRYVLSYEINMSSNNKLADVGPVTANVVRYDATDSLACSPLAAGALAGKIALIPRGGSCITYQKTKNAQNAGAVGVIVYQADGAAAGTLSSGPDNTITIPGVLVNRVDGLALSDVLSGGGTLNVTLRAPVNIDGDFDNGVIVHEYGHGISNRLTGGPATTSCLQNAEQMGEGWSDYFALMLTTNWATAAVNDAPNKRGIGTYVLGQDTSHKGIRTFPYSTDMTVNQWTYGMLATNTSGSAHKIGEIWAATLWDMTWNMIAIDGINPNLWEPGTTGGNSAALKLVMQGLKLQPCSPGFINGRDAILKADTALYNARYSCAIWKAFARRGMGINASQGSSSSFVDQIQNFTMPTIAIDTTAIVCDSIQWRGDTYYNSGDYTKNIEQPGGCAATITLHLTVNTSPTISSVTAGSTLLCAGTTTNLNANGVGGTGATVDWYTGTNGTGTHLGSGLSLNNVGPGQTYYALVNGVCGAIEASLRIYGDTIKPSISCPSNITQNNSIGCSKSVSTSDPVYSDNCTVTSLTWAMTGATTLASGSGGIRLVGTKTFNNGTTLVTYTVRDNNARTSTCSFTVEVVDVTKPSFTSTVTNINHNVVSGCTKQIAVPAVSFTDNCGTPVLTWVMTGATTGSGTGQIGTKKYNVGTTTVTYTITDAAANTKSISFNVILKDVILPVITCPSNITTTVTGTGCSKFVATPAPTFSDNCAVTGLSWTMTGATTLSSIGGGIRLVGSKQFNAGTTTVTYTAKDAAGNLATCSFTVEVNAPGCTSASMARGAVNEESNSNGLSMSISPNPSVSSFVVNIRSINKEKVRLNVYNNEGRKVQSMIVMPGQNTRLGANYIAGTYLFEVIQGVRRSTAAAVKQ